MNTRQKVALSVLTPLLTLSVLHTIINRGNAKQETAKIETCDSTRMDDSLRIQSAILPVQFKAERNLNKQLFKKINQYQLID